MSLKPLAQGALVGALVLLVAPAYGANILYNTGIDDNSDQLDDNWTLLVTQGSTSVYGPYVQPDTAVHANWVKTADSDVSQWLTPTPVATASLDSVAPDGKYLYTLTFDLTGYKTSNASFSGRWASDNNAVASLNGHQFSGTGSTGFGAWTAFDSTSVSSYFNAGVNTLEFEVTNIAQLTGNPTGLRVEFTNVVAVPEPHEWAMMLSGLSMIGMIAARRRKLPRA